MACCFILCSFPPIFNKTSKRTMRKFINVSKQRQKALVEQFPSLVELAAGDNCESYTYLAVTIFDHWLSREDAEELLFNQPESEYARRRLMFQKFNLLLAEQTELLSLHFKGLNQDKPMFKAFTNSQLQNDYLTASDRHMFTLALPLINAVYFEGYDDTNVFYIKEPSARSFIESIATQAGLHCLEQASAYE